MWNGPGRRRRAFIRADRIVCVTPQPVHLPVTWLAVARSSPTPRPCISAGMSRSTRLCRWALQSSAASVCRSVADRPDSGHSHYRSAAARCLGHPGGQALDSVHGGSGGDRLENRASDHHVRQFQGEVFQGHRGNPVVRSQARAEFHSQVRNIGGHESRDVHTRGPGKGDQGAIEPDTDERATSQQRAKGQDGRNLGGDARHPENRGCPASLMPSRPAQIQCPRLSRFPFPTRCLQMHMPRLSRRETRTKRRSRCLSAIYSSL